MADTLSPEKIKALIAELRAKAIHEHGIALELDPYTVNERGEKCPYPTPTIAQRLPSRAADALETLLRSHTDAVMAWEAGREAAAKRAERMGTQRRTFEKTDHNDLYTGEYEYRDVTYREFDDGDKVAQAIRALQPPASLGAPECADAPMPVWVEKVRTLCAEAVAHIDRREGSHLTALKIEQALSLLPSAEQGIQK